MKFDFFSQTENRIFSHVDIPFFLDIRKLRFDFYSPAREVSIEAIGPQSGSTPHYGRIEAYNANDELIGFDLSGPLVGRLRETISVASANDDIAYAIAYADTDTFLNSDPFGRFDRFEYKQLEAAAVTDDNGQFEIKHLFPGQYDVSVLGDQAGLIGAVPERIVVSKYENFVFNGSKGGVLHLPLGGNHYRIRLLDGNLVRLLDKGCKLLLPWYRHHYRECFIHGDLILFFVIDRLGPCLRLGR